MNWEWVFRTVIGVALAVLAGCESFVLETPEEPVAEVSASGEPDVVIALINNLDLSYLLDRKARRVGYRLIERETLPGLGVVLLSFQIPPGLSPTAAALELERLEPHATADRDHLYTLQQDMAMSAGAGSPRRFAEAMMGLPAGGCATRHRVGMIDSAVDQGVPSLTSRSIVAKPFIRTADASARSHGTAVAEMLIGEGRLAGATLYSAVVLDEARTSGGPGASTLIRALDWLAQSGVRVVNVSLAGPYNRALDRAIQRASAAGMIIVAAVGNDGPRSPPRYPAAFESVIAVTAIDSAMEIYKSAVIGSHVDFAAPGVDVFVQAGGDGRYLTGTSFASPFVASIIASDPALDGVDSPGAVRDVLRAAARDLGAPGHDEVYGHGLAAFATACTEGR